MITVSEAALGQALGEYLSGPPPGEVTGQWLDRLIFQIDDSNQILATYMRHLLHVAQERHGDDAVLDIVLMSVWTVFRAEQLTVGQN